LQEDFNRPIRGNGACGERLGERQPINGLDDIGPGCDRPRLVALNLSNHVPAQGRCGMCEFGHLQPSLLVFILGDVSAAQVPKDSDI
jgi:hypothetical protein